MFRKPGDYCSSIGAYNCYSLTLDFSHKKQNLYGSYDRNDSKNTIQEICTNPLLDLITSHFISSHNSDCVKIYDQLTYNVQKADSKNANTTPTEYIISIRLSNAKQLLSESNLTVFQIAELCDFNDA